MHRSQGWVPRILDPRAMVWVLWSASIPMHHRVWLTSHVRAECWQNDAHSQKLRAFTKARLHQCNPVQKRCTWVLGYALHSNDIQPYACGYTTATPLPR